jgi:lipopolysaccharide/colanic/teichoic acid biosynthesis glycosyltransferase
MRNLSKLSLILLQFLFVVVIPPLLVSPSHFWNQLQVGDPIFNACLINAIALIVGLKVLIRLETYPQKRPSIYIVPIGMTIYGLLLAVLIFLHLQYSAKVILVGFLSMPPMMAAYYLLDRRHHALRLFCVPSGEISRLKNTPLIKFKPLTKPQLPKTSFDGVVVDFRDESITPEWARFLSECALHRVRIYNYLQLSETLSGQVDVTHLMENDLGDLSPPEFVMASKRVIDVVFLTFISPIAIPLMLVIAIWIVLDSKGGPFYIQTRMGLGGKHFDLVKFRSMTVDHGGTHFTERDECHRITKVGKFIRKYRLDELPQFWNVLKGEMSLIGPRPESEELAKWYQEEVPFFMYRHVVRPGISGWAQVMHGYAAGVEEMKDKLSFDFYYIKHFSLWLDLLIWYKTIKTVVTGFGSR